MEMKRAQTYIRENLKGTYWFNFTKNEDGKYTLYLCQERNVARVNRWLDIHSVTQNWTVPVVAQRTKIVELDGGDDVFYRQCGCFPTSLSHKLNG